MAWRLSRHSRRKVEEDDYADLLVFGYSCKVFRDGEKAEWVVNGRNLVPHPHQTENLMDRYDCLEPSVYRINVAIIPPKMVSQSVTHCSHDCRLHLVDLDTFEHVPDPDEERDVEEEEVVDEERYRDMLTDEQLNELHIEEELKRLAAQTGSGGAEVGYEYEGNGDPEGKEDSEEEVDEPYVPRVELKVPKGTTMPLTVRENAIMEKTAAFIAAQGPQMEIVLKAKQKDANKFIFLNFDDPLNGYYRHVVKMIREGKYTPIPHVPKKKPKIVKEEAGSESDSDSSGGYLHPSLLGGGGGSKGYSESSPRNAGTPNLPTIQYKLGQEDDVYSALFNNLSALMPKKVEVMKEEDEIKNEDHPPQVPPQEFAQWYEWFYGTAPPYPNQPKVIPPPPSLQAVVDKTADFVAKFGPKAEQHLKSRVELQLDFLDHSHMYYPYYQLKIRWTQYDDYMRSQYAARNPGAPLTSMPPDPSLTAEVPCTYADVRESEPPSGVPPPFPHLLSRVTDNKNPTTPPPAGTIVKKRRGFYDLPTEGVAESENVKKPVSFAIGQTSSTSNQTGPSLLPRPKQLDNEGSSGEEEEKGKTPPPHKIDNTSRRRSRKRRLDVPPAGFQMAPPTVLIMGQPSFVPPPIPPIPKPDKVESAPPEKRVSEDILDVEETIEKAVETSTQDPSDKQLQLQRKLRAQMFLNKLRAKKGPPECEVSQRKSRSRSPISSYP